VQASSADVTIPGPGNTSIVQHYGGGSVTWVDGGMLANFPIDAFDRVDGQPRAGNHRIQAVVQALEINTVACHESSQEAMRVSNHDERVGPIPRRFSDSGTHNLCDKPRFERHPISI